MFNFMKKIFIFTLFFVLFFVSGCGFKSITKPAILPVPSDEKPVEIAPVPSDEKPVEIAPATNSEKPTEVEGEIPTHLISASQITQMGALMAQNGKSLKGLQAYGFEKDQFGMTHIRFNLYVNGLLADETIYHFKADDSFSNISNEVDISAYSGVSTIAAITQDQAIAIASQRIKNKTLEAVKKFFDKNAGSSDGKSIILVWAVRPLGGKYPSVMVDAQSGEIIRYDDGLRY
jgi:Zn-dependent metalloprotease